MRRRARRRHCDVAFGLARGQDDQRVDVGQDVDSLRDDGRLGPPRT